MRNAPCLWLICLFLSFYPHSPWSCYSPHLGSHPNVFDGCPFILMCSHKSLWYCVYILQYPEITAALDVFLIPFHQHSAWKICPYCCRNVYYVVSNSHVALYRGRALLLPCLSPGDRHRDGLQFLARTKSPMKNILISVLSQPVWAFLQDVFCGGLWAYRTYVDCTGLKLPQMAFQDDCTHGCALRQEIFYFLLLLPTLGMIRLSKLC